MVEGVVVWFLVVPLGIAITLYTVMGAAIASQRS